MSAGGKKDRLASAPLRSEAIDELLESTPSWLMRHGIATTCAVLVSMFALAGAFRYPEVVRGEVTLTSRTPPVAVVARSDGALEQWRVVEGQRVEKGALLGVIESSAVADDVLALEAVLQRFLQEPWLEVDARWPRGGRFGELGGSYAELLRALQERAFFESQHAHRAQLVAVQAQKRTLQQLQRGVSEEGRLLGASQALWAAQRTRDDQLADAGALSQAAREEVARALLGEQVKAATARSSGLRHEVERAALERSALGIEQEERALRERLERSVEEQLQRLRAQIDVWAHRHLLRAPAAGEVVFFDVWAAEQRARAGQELVYVVPEVRELRARVVLSQIGFGRTRIGQEVRIWLDSYPAPQFGTVRARVAQRSATTKDGEFSVLLEFPDGLRTTFGRQLELIPGLRGQAHIVTDDVRLVTRVLGPLRVLWQGGRP